MRNVSLDLINKINNYILIQKFSADATLAILNKDISVYEQQIREHIKKYTLYLIWLDDNKKDLNQAWEKYVARVEVLDAKNNVKVVNEQKTKALIQDLNDPYSLINKQKQKQKRLSTLSEKLWKQQNDKPEQKQIAFEEVVLNDGEVLITNIVSETIDNELTSETIEDLTAEDTVQTALEVYEQEATDLIDSVNKTITDNFNKIDDLAFDDEIIDLTSTFEELKTSETQTNSERTIEEIISTTFQQEKANIIQNDLNLYEELEESIHEQIENEDLIFENYDDLANDEKTIGIFEEENDNYSTMDIIEEIEDIEELILIDETNITTHDDTFVNSLDLDETKNDSIQTADYDELQGDALSFEEPNKEIRFNSEEDKVHFLHEKDYIKEGIGNKFDIDRTQLFKTEINELVDEPTGIRTEDYAELEEDSINIFDEANITTHDDTFVNSLDLDETKNDSIQTADYDELQGDALSFEEPNKEIRFNSEEDKVHFLHEKDYIKEGIGNKFDIDRTQLFKTEINELVDEPTGIRTEDYAELEELTNDSLFGEETDLFDSFDANDESFEESSNEYDEIQEESINKTILETPIKIINNESNDKILFGHIDEEFDSEIQKELTQINETISNLESYTQKHNEEELIFNEEERTLFEFEAEEFEIDETMFENVTLSSGLDEEQASTIDALKFLNEVEDKYNNLLVEDLSQEILEDAKEDSTIDALNFLNGVEDKYNNLLSSDLSQEILEDAKEDSTIDALRFLDSVEDKYSNLLGNLSDDELETIDNLNWQSNEELYEIETIRLDHIAKVGEVIDYNNREFMVVGMSEKTNNLGEIVETILISENGDIDNSIELIVEIE
ncbi:hypothetical protein CK556_01945 [Mesoplasma chauliocola]|uniref:Uncharacterized protein n=1 Tax=Mesoplasma chauliocola TaxID=216427 RepID=A0A249SND6_9MOLU|nr:hypothetical protein [Mesoplasma chauliocola]ASZ09117.1 hypothetical protein CK556_01945 [Mesoplasma chauliocola]